MARILPGLARVFLGLIFLGAGVNGYLVLFGFEPVFPTSPAATKLLQGYLLALVKSVEIICGVLLLINRWVPLALNALAPLAINILAFHLFVDHDLLALGLIVALLEAYLLWTYRRSYRQLMSR